jgi:hypothetical protein
MMDKVQKKEIMSVSKDFTSRPNFDSFVENYLSFHMHRRTFKQ